ncbi:NPFR1, partial [Drosophila busckii]
INDLNRSTYLPLDEADDSSERFRAYWKDNKLDLLEERRELNLLLSKRLPDGTNDTILGNGSFNASYFPPEMGPEFIKQFLHNRAIESPWYQLLIGMYIALIVFGAIGNTMVVIAVLRKPMMRTARNLFILNLAVSDLLLCLVTMPLTLMEIISKFWPYGSCAMLCKTIAMLQALSIFVSTISITAIAFDRYQVIVYPTRDSLQFVGAVVILVGIWLLALLLASPMWIYKQLINKEMPPLLQEFGVPETISYCIEDWPVRQGRLYFSIFSLCVQYLVPILIVSVAYFGIYNKLKSRITVTVQSSSQRKVERGRRMARTNRLLISIAIIFGVSWLPLNFFNLYADMHGLAFTQGRQIAYAICHMIGMSSACSNPLLYGWLNDNFRKEFLEILCRSHESINVDLHTNTTGSNLKIVQPRHRRKQGADLSKGELKLLGKSTACGATTDGDGEVDADGIVSMATTEFNTGHNGHNGMRSALTESVVSTEIPLANANEKSVLMPR